MRAASGTTPTMPGGHPDGEAPSRVQNAGWLITRSPCGRLASTAAGESRRSSSIGSPSRAGGIRVSSRPWLSYEATALRTASRPPAADGHQDVEALQRRRGDFHLAARPRRSSGAKPGPSSSRAVIAGSAGSAWSGQGPPGRSRRASVSIRSAMNRSSATGARHQCSVSAGAGTMAVRSSRAGARPVRRSGPGRGNLAWLRRVSRPPP